MPSTGSRLAHQPLDLSLAEAAGHGRGDHGPRPTCTCVQLRAPMALRPWEDTGQLTVSSRSHIPLQVKENFGCFSPNPRDRKVPTVTTSEQPILEGHLPRLTHLHCQIVRPLASTPSLPWPCQTLHQGRGFPSPCPGVQLPPWLPGGLFLLAGHRAQWTLGRLAGGQERAAPAAGWTPPWAPACSGPAPPSPEESRAPGAGQGRSPAGEHPGVVPQAGTGREPFLLRPSHPTG